MSKDIESLKDYYDGVNSGDFNFDLPDAFYFPMMDNPWVDYNEMIKAERDYVNEITEMFEDLNDVNLIGLALKEFKSNVLNYWGYQD